MDVNFLKSAFRPEHYPPADLPEVAFAGKSNVGKSSLINTLTNRRNLARTSSTPGRTQSINFFRMDRRLLLVDLPGYGFARVPKKIQASWKDMVEAYLQGRPTLRAVVVILDIRRGPSQDDQVLFSWLAHCEIPSVPVLTKADKLSRQKASRQRDRLIRELSDLTPVPPILFSARTRQGRNALWRQIDALTDSSSIRQGVCDPV